MTVTTARPTLLGSCARAATASEARFRVDYPNASTRTSKIVALDPPAVALLEPLTGQSWRGARFLTSVGAADQWDPSDPSAAVVRAFDGDEVTLARELDGADVAVMVATGPDGAQAAAVIGRAADDRRIMTAGLVVGAAEAADAAVRALRPYASVLVVSGDPHYVRDVLTALRA